MKKMIWIAGCLLVAGLAFAQHAHDADGCDCPSCRAKESGKFTLPGLEGLNEQEACEQDHDHEAHADEEKEGHVHEEPGALDDPDHDQEGGADNHPAEGDACCPDDAAAADLHDHDGDGVADHDSHDEPVADAQAGVGGIELSDELMAKVGIQLQQAKGGTVARTSVFPAEIKLNRDRTAAISPRYPSIVRQVFVEIGDTIRKGDVLASLENRETMAVYSVSAPRDGVIISKDLAAGEAAAEDRVLYEVADLSSVWADISIFPKYQHLIRRGMKVELIAHDGHSARGTVQYISPLVSHETRTFTARCVLEGAREDFTPGAFVRARIAIEQANVEVAVPLDAVQMLDGHPVVFVPGDHGFQTLEIRTGLIGGGKVQILSGLKPGDDYVAKGAFALKAQLVTSGMDPHAGHGH